MLLIREKHGEMSKLGFFEASSASIINLDFSTLASGRLLGQGQKTTHNLHQNTTRMINRQETKIVFWNSLSQAPIFHITVSTIFFHDIRMAHDDKLKAFPSVQNPNIHIPPKESVLRSITAVVQSLVPTSILFWVLLQWRDTTALAEPSWMARILVFLLQHFNPSSKVGFTMTASTCLNGALSQVLHKW